MTENQIPQRIHMSNGLSLYKTGKNLDFIETIGQSFIFNATKNYKSKFEYQ